MASPSGIWPICPAREEIGRAKYEEESTWRSAYDKIEADLQSQIRELERKAGEEQ